jgi:hypothetical protein
MAVMMVKPPSAQAPKRHIAAYSMLFRPIRRNKPAFIIAKSDPLYRRRALVRDKRKI